MYNVWDRIKSGVSEIVRTRVFVVMIVFIILFSILVGRLFNLQIVNGQKYLDDYKLLIQKTRVIQGTRGKIYDRNGVLLAYNELAYSVTIEDNGSYATIAEKNEELNQEITRIIEIVEENGDSVINDFNIVLDSNNEYQYAMDNETLRLRFIADVFGEKTIDKLDDEQKNMTAEDIIVYLCTDEEYGYGIDQEKLEKSQVLKLVNIRYAMGLNSFQKYIPTTVAEDVSEETVASIMENLDGLQGVDIAEDSLRRYTDSKYFANMIGYTGQISQAEYDALSKSEQKNYSLTDTVGKAGLEQVMDETLQGEKGEVKLYVNSVGKVIETAEDTEPKAGNNLYLTIDANLQKAAYDILEQELAGILLVKMADVLDYDRSKTTDAGDVIVASGDVYNAFIGNDILDTNHFSSEDAGQAERSVYASFSAYKEAVLGQIVSIMLDGAAAAYTDMPREQQAYLSYIVNDLLTSSASILMKDAIDTSDETYLKWREEETININTYLNYAISKNWIDSSKLQEYTPEGEKYSDAADVYTALVSYVEQALRSDRNFDKLIYKYMIKSGAISGREICMMIYEQNILPFDETQYNQLASGAVSAYDFIRGKIQTLEITPGQLALEPCTGSLVMTDPNSGEVLACVSYPGYDNNRLANTMDSAYYNKLVTDQARPFYNNATQEKTAPGSTYKPLSAIAGLTEGTISLGTSVYCDGVFKRVEPNIKCWVYPDSHGTQDVVGAITHSCNVFFCDLGYNMSLDEQGAYSSELGLSRLGKYAAMFGLDETSGMEIPESEPQISDDSSVPSAMGQGTNNFTTSQLARYVTAVANEGTVYNLSLLGRVEKVDSTLVEDYQPEIRNQVEGISPDTWDAVHAGMRGVVSNNTVFTKLNASGIELCGKTGTAQQSTTHPDHGLFVGFTSNTDSDVAFAIRIANGYSSTFAAEVGKSVMEYYYNITDPSELITGQASTVTVTSHGD
ncbi:penicillin-binding transpeptidase domain-containing protein [Sporofaciens sp. SGI.106]|uniref:penicillin-binding transpeptidase domain-containing protein n=1 Tax=Sporofaciens sp. SGI.106 TaxID=3420568 RepID=UPI002A9FE6FD|nr:penicillin-binding transpeptidase domain-containing protein [Lachnoclostridium sp.]